MIFEIIRWYLAVTFLGIISFPFSNLFFSSLKDRGYFFAKAIGILNFAAISWLLANYLKLSLDVSLIISLVAMLAISAASYLYQKVEFSKGVLLNICIGELASVLIFAVLVVYKSYAPVIKDVEKMMDLTLLNAVLKANALPMQDPWFSSHTVNYYYFSHIMVALVTKLSDVGSSLAFNLSSATNYLIFITTTYSFIYNFVGKRAYAFLGAASAALVGNLSYFYQKYLVHVSDLNWWGVTRVIPGVVTEVPLFSFFISDLHPHFMSLELVVLTALLIYLYLTANNKILPYYLGVVMGVLFLNNSWDIIVYGIILFVVFALKNIDTVFRLPFSFTYFKNLFLLALQGIKILVLFLFMILPFYISFHPGTQGFRLVDYARTGIGDFMLVYGVQMYLVFAYFLILFLRSRKYGKDDGWLTFLLISVGISAVMLAVSPLVSLLTFCFLLVVRGAYKTKETPEKYVYILVAFSLILYIFCEIFYLKDIYGPNYQRFNTVFKLHYQAMILLFLTLPFLCYNFAKNFEKRTRYLLVPFFIGLALSFTYLPYALMESTSSFSKNYGLDGEYYFKHSLPDDYGAIQWFRNNVSSQVVVMEKPGEAYSDDSIVSVFTGNLNPIGWFNHEWGWRNNYKELAVVKADINEAYTGADEAGLRKTISKYKIQYIYVGKSENSAYEQVATTVFDKVAKKVFSKGKVAVWRVDN